MRARQRAAIETADRPPLRDAAELLLPAVEQAIGALGLDEEDTAAAQLARGYARIIDQARDQAWAYRWIGPLLASALDSLQATPAARARVKPQQGPRPLSALDRLREQHSRQQARQL